MVDQARGAGRRSRYERLAWTAAAGLAVLPGHAQAQPATAADSGEIVVTAQKRAESIQSVPISIQAFDTAALAERSITSFNDYAKFLPSLSYESYGPGQADIFFRGISNGNRLSTGSLPTVGVYLDEQPVTTIAEALDVHIYDIERVEALAGPQGTLYGASSEAGTLRIITNKPVPGRFEGGADLTVDHVAHGDFGGSAEGFVNLPLADNAAIRLVGFYQREGGYIDNVRGEPGLVFPTSGIERDNSDLVEDDVNAIDTWGGRAALRVELDDNWTATPSVIYQKQRSHGTFGFRPALGDLDNARYTREGTRDEWAQAALTIEGKIGTFDVTYAGAWFERTAEYTADYSDYAYFYDLYYASAPEYFGAAFFDNDGNLIDPSQITTNHENFTKQSHELRIASPAAARFRFVAGLFYQRQTNDWENLYTVPGLADAQSVTGLPGVNYANIQFRTDRDYAAFAQASYDIVPTLTLTAGGRIYRYDNDVVGFFGYNADRSEVGEAICFPGTFGTVGNRKPCDNIDAKARGSGFRHKLNLSWTPDRDRLFYATWSTGFRPGGINRRPTAAPYQPEELSNYEIGWKTSWFGRRLRINGALFLEKLSQAQFGVSSDQNGITDIVNAGRAQSRGVEGEIAWTPLRGLTLSSSATYVDAKIKTNLCQYVNDDFDCSIPSPAGAENATTAPAGTRFPTTPKFKMAATIRYEFPFAGGEAHVQSSFFHQSAVYPTLTVADRPLLGRQPAYSTADVSLGFARDGWSAELAVENAFDRRANSVRYASCAISLCGAGSIQILPIRATLVSLRLARRF